MQLSCICRMCFQIFLFYVLILLLAWRQASNTNESWNMACAFEVSNSLWKAETLSEGAWNTGFTCHRMGEKVSQIKHTWLSVLIILCCHTSQNNSFQLHFCVKQKKTEKSQVLLISCELHESCSLACFSTVPWSFPPSCVHHHLQGGAQLYIISSILSCFLHSK